MTAITVLNIFKINLVDETLKYMIRYAKIFTGDTYIASLVLIPETASLNVLLLLTYKNNPKLLNVLVTNLSVYYL